MKKEILVKVNVGKHKRGDPYPQIDFSDLTCAGVYNKSGAVAYSQETLQNQIYNGLTKNSDKEEICYFYYTLTEIECGEWAQQC